MNTGIFWAAALAGALVSLVLGELADVSAWIAPKLIRSASSRLPTPQFQERYQEEWLNELSAFDGLKMIKLAKAISIWISSWRMRTVLRHELGSFDLRTSGRRLVSGIVEVARTAWSRKPMGEDHGLEPGPELFYFTLLLMSQVTSRTARVSVKSSDDKGFRITISPETEAIYCASWLMALTRVLTVFFYDLSMVRKRRPFSELWRQHSKVWRGLEYGQPVDG